MSADPGPAQGVPRAADGGPIRVDGTVQRLLRRGVRPERIGPVWPVVGDPVPGSGRMLRPVTFAADAAPGHEVMVHVNGVTDAHREDIRPALMERMPDSDVHALTYLLPDDLCASYRFAAAPRLPRDAGATREGWLRIHGLGRPDPRNPDRLPNPLGTASSVLTMPAAPRHRAWTSDEAADPPPITTVALPDAPVTLVHGDPSRVLVLFDGELWERLGVVAALARRGGPPTTVLVPSGPLPRRAALLPHPDRLLAHLEDELVPAVSEAIGGWDADRTVVAGQSYGGLAAAITVCLRPEIARTAIVQSGSFHFRSGDAGRPPAGQAGDLVEALSGDRVSGRFVVQAGTEESGMIAGAASFVEAVRTAGAEVTSRWYTGGHDYAWWRTGLFDALDGLDARFPLDGSRSPGGGTP